MNEFDHTIITRNHSDIVELIKNAGHCLIDKADSFAGDILMDGSAPTVSLEISFKVTLDAGITPPELTINRRFADITFDMSAYTAQDHAQSNKVINEAFNIISTDKEKDGNND